MSCLLRSEELWRPFRAFRARPGVPTYTYIHFTYIQVEHSKHIMAQVYRKVQFNYSMKNIPIPSKDDYVLQLIHSIEKFIKNLRWRVKCSLKPPTEQKETYGFPSPKHPGSVQDLKLLEQRLLAMVRDIKIRIFL